MPGQKILRFELDGKWHAHEFSVLLGAVAHMYSTAALMYLLNDLQRRLKDYPQFKDYIASRTTEIASLLTQDDPEKIYSFLDETDFSVEAKQLNIEVPSNLQVAAIRFESPGSIDLLGLGKIIDAICQAYKHTLEFIDKRPDRQKKKLEQIREYVEIAKQHGGMSDNQIQRQTVELLAKYHYGPFLWRFHVKKMLKPPKALPPPEHDKKKK
jgi:hypothetical protein